MNGLKGTGVALVTPFTEALEIDYPSLDKVINYVLDGGVNYLVVMGTTGESPTVSWEEKLEVLDHVIATAGSKTKIVFGLGGNNTADIVRKLAELNKKQIAAILSASPYYNKPSQKGLIAHYSAIADASEKPVILYNVPARTASNIHAETTLELAKHRNIIGVKEASGDLGQVSKILEERPEDFLVLSGDDQLTLPIISMGGHGVISVAANAYPKEFCRMVNESLAGNNDNAAAAHKKINTIFELLSEEGNPTSVKAALYSKNLCLQTVRLPLVEASHELINKFEKENQSLS